MQSVPLILTCVAGGLAIFGVIKPSPIISSCAVFILAVAFFVFLKQR